jgi:hypothetical protein
VADRCLPTAPSRRPPLSRASNPTPPQYPPSRQHPPSHHSSTHQTSTHQTSTHLLCAIKRRHTVKASLLQQAAILLRYTQCSSSTTISPYRTFCRGHTQPTHTELQAPRHPTQCSTSSPHRAHLQRPQVVAALLDVGRKALTGLALCRAAGAHTHTACGLVGRLLLR